MWDIASVGSLNVDLSVFTPIKPQVGETVMGSKFVLGFGGKGVNQCVAASLLRCKSAMIGKVGNDQFGQAFLNALRNFSVETGGITITDSCETGVASIVVHEQSGSNQIIVVPGANMLLSPKDIEQANQAGLLNSRVVLFQFEISPEATLFGLKMAKHNGSITILNPAPAPRPSLNPEVKGYYELLPELLPHCNFVCPNESEALCIIRSAHLDINAQGDTIQSLSSDNIPVQSLIPCLLWLARQGVQWPIVTLGSNGLMFLVPESVLDPTLPPDCLIIEKVCSESENKLVVQVMAPHIDHVVDTTGAGDCFVGALAYFLSCHPDIGILEQLRRSVWVASQSVRKIGTQLSFPSHDNLPKTIFEPGQFDSSVKI